MRKSDLSLRNQDMETPGLEPRTPVPRHPPRRLEAAGSHVGGGPRKPPPDKQQRDQAEQSLEA